MIKLLKKFLLPLVLLFCTVTVSFASWITTQGSTVEIGLPETTEGLKKVAYLASDKTTFYTSIEKAVDVANNKGGDTVYVIPGANPTITRSFQINTGVTLIFPYSEELYTVDKNVVGNEDLITAANNKPESWSSIITLAAGKTIEVLGELIIGGEIDYGGAPKNNTPCTISVLQMNARSKVVVGDGSAASKLRIYGRIVNFTYDSSGSNVAGDHDETTSVIINDGSKVYLPLTIYDFIGGTNTATDGYVNLADAAAGKECCKVFPISKFDLPYISAPLTLNYGAEMIGQGRIGAFNKQNFVDNIYFVTSENEGFIETTTGSIVVDFDIKQGTSKFVGSNLSNHTTTIDVNGEINIGCISVSLDVNMEILFIKIKTVLLSTKTTSIPIPYGYTIRINQNAYVETSSSIYFANNSNLIVAEGGEVIINKDTTNSNNPGIVFLPNSRVINNGTITVNGVSAGFIESENTTGSAQVIMGSNYSGIDTSGQILFNTSPTQTAPTKAAYSTFGGYSSIYGNFYSIPESRMVPTMFEPGTTYTYENQTENANPAWGLHDVLKYEVTVEEAGDAGTVDGYTDTFYATPEGTSTKTTLKIILKEGYRKWYIYRYNYYVYTIEISGSVDSILWDDDSVALSRDGNARNNGDLTAELTISGPVKITFGSKRTS